MLKIGVIDDHKLIRNSLCMLINTFENINVVLEADNGKNLLEKLLKIPVDVILLDIQMPVMDGFETSQKVSKLYPHIKILILSQLVNKETIYRALDSGAHGYLSKSSHHGELEVAIRKVYTKGHYFDPELGAFLHAAILWNEKSESHNPLKLLNDRDFELIKLVCQGYSSSDIAEKFSLNIRTVETQRRRIVEKTDAKNFLGVIIMGIKHGRLSVDDL